MIISLNRHKTIITLVCSCLISLLLSWWTLREARRAEPYNDSLRYKASAVFTPVHFCSSVISSVWFRVAYAGSVFVSLWQKPADKTRLQELEDQVEYLKRQLDAERDANRKRLEELYMVCTNLAGVAGEVNPEFKLVPAKVIGVEPSDWFRYLTINRGAKDGVNVDMAVITRSDMQGEAAYLASAVVGKVVEVQDHAAKVQLITDRLSVVAVTIGSQGDLGLLKGQPETEGCFIDAIPSTSYDMLEKGHIVVVDERSHIFPPGILVGRISAIGKGTHFCRVEVQPAFKFSKLKEVMIVLESGR